MITNKTKAVLKAAMETAGYKKLKANHVRNYSPYTIDECFGGFEHANDSHVEKTLEGIYQLSQGNSAADYSGNGSTSEGRREGAKELIEYLASQGITRGVEIWKVGIGKVVEGDRWSMELR